MEERKRKKKGCGIKKGKSLAGGVGPRTGAREGRRPHRLMWASASAHLGCMWPGRAPVPALQYDPEDQVLTLTGPAWMGKVLRRIT